MTMRRAVLALIFLAGAAISSQFQVPWGGVTSSGGGMRSANFFAVGTMGAGAGIFMQSPNFRFRSGLQALPPSIRFTAKADVAVDSNWRMVSLFFEPSNPDIATLFPDSTLKTFYWDPTATPTEEFLKFVHPTQVRLGRSAWVKIPSGVKTFTPQGLAVVQEEPVGVRLDPGWNQIANPFVFPISFASLQGIVNGTRLDFRELVKSGVLKGSLFFWDGKGYQQFDELTGVLSPGEGYFIFVTQPLTLIYFPVSPQALLFKNRAAQKSRAYWTSSALRFSSGNAGEWTAKISAENSLGGDSDNFFGIRNVEKAKLDALNVPEPPAPESAITLYFDNGKEKLTNLFLASEGVWHLVVTSPHNKLPVTLKWSGDPNFSQNGAVLVDLQRKDFVDMAQQTSYTFTMPLKNRAEFEIRAGAAASGLFKLSRAYSFPNPTSSLISFMLQGKGKPGPVTIEFFSANGGRLMQTTVTPVGAGKGKYKARAKDAEDAMRHFANGVYFYRIRTSNGLGGVTTTVGKLVLLR